MYPSYFTVKTNENIYVRLIVEYEDIHVRQIYVKNTEKMT